MRHSRRACLTVIVMLAACAAPPATTPSDSETASNAPAATATASASPTAAAASARAEPQPLEWAPLAVIGPPAREDHTWTVDPSSGIAYLFGGRDGTTILGDTWAFDLATDTWSQLQPTTSPPARFGHEAVWAEGIGVVIFAGQAGSTFFGDLWAFDPGAATWTQLPAAGDLPTPRYGSCASIGPDGRLWISHGFTQDQVRFSDTRAYDFATNTWTDETPGDGPRPVERCLHGCWWTVDGELTLYAGQTTGTLALDDRWELADGAWTRVEGSVPAARNLYARVRVGDAALVFGGQAVDGSYLDDLWLLEDGAPDARQVEPTDEGRPAGRAGAEMILDVARNRALLFGGRFTDGVLGDLWSLDGL